MPTDVDRNETRQLLAAGAQLVEVLPEKEYQQAHLPGAFNVPLKSLNRETVARLGRDQAVVVYCHDFQ
ncbi:MAG: rhodanese-like domain-containing protein [Anaerolineales bacterium]